MGEYLTSALYEHNTKPCTVWVVTIKQPRSRSEGLCHIFDSKEAATKWVLRTKRDRGVQMLVGSVPQFRIEGRVVKTMAEVK